VVAAAAAGEDVHAGLRLAEGYGMRLPQPGAGATALRWQLLADVAAQVLTAARILEAHSDALAILTESTGTKPGGTEPGRADLAGCWGVFAAEAPGVALRATDADGWTVDGTKPWCSLAGVLDRALVTAQVGTGRAVPGGT
jgi:alkylation response protein AidB-like acyl-CoA dehydrogenase